MLMDTYFPFDEGPGASSYSDRWRLMARIWAFPGVVGGRLNELALTLGTGEITVDTGAVWILGCYGENTSTKDVTVTSDGMLVARLDVAANTIELVFREGVSVPSKTEAIWELPLALMVSSSMVDVRTFTTGDTNPPGTVIYHGGSTLPRGYLAADGSAVRRVIYDRLFAAIGTVHGSGDGSTTFNVPDARDRSPAAVGGAVTLASKFGEAGHALSIAELASHNHREVGGGGGEMAYTAVSSNALVVGGGGQQISWGYPYTDPTGSGNAHNTWHPCIGLTAAIKY